MGTSGSKRSPPSARVPRAAATGVPVFLALLACGACTTQRWPAPMGGLGGASSGLPAPDPSGIDEVLVLRHGDPVEVRQAGALGSYPLRFYRKQERVRPGGLVLVGAGGKAEVLWPGLPTSALLLGQAVARIGATSAGEPALTFEELENARVQLAAGHSVALIGGARLSGDANEEQGGPYLVERIAPDLMRVRNQSRASCSIEYRDEQIVLQPGELVELAILGAGSAPSDHEEQTRVVKSPGGPVSLQGQVEARTEGADVALRGTSGGGSAVARGIEIRLAAGASALLTGLAPTVAPASPASIEPKNAPAPESAPGSAPAPTPVPSTAPTTPPTPNSP